MGGRTGSTKKAPAQMAVAHKKGISKNQGCSFCFIQFMLLPLLISSPPTGETITGSIKNNSTIDMTGLFIFRFKYCIIIFRNTRGAGK